MSVDEMHAPLAKWGDQTARNRVPKKEALYIYMLIARNVFKLFVCVMTI